MEDGMLEIDIELLKPGITFNKPLFDERNSRIASPNSPITKEEIEILKKWGIKKIYTEGKVTSGHDLLKIKKELEKEEKIIVDAEVETQNDKFSLLELYDGWVTIVADILKDLNSGFKFDKQIILRLVDKFVEIIPKNKEKFISIAQSRETEEYLYGHSLNMAIISVIIGSAMKYPVANIKLLAISALLCDIGMLKIPKHIREKTVALNEKDIKLIKTHPTQSYIIIKNSGLFSDIVANVALQLHENHDGSGYPKGISGEHIHDFAKIISIADSFDAMSKKRSFRKEKVPHNIMKALLKSNGKKFDPKIMRVFLIQMAVYPVGSMVQLETNELGIVCSVNEKDPLKPKLKLLYDSKYKRLKNEEVKIIDLLKHPEIKIKKVVNPKDLGISIVNEI
jgi:HD-GYP domain-containing protein (c-di-GMP phosphodiesterase class II)